MIDSSHRRTDRSFKVLRFLGIPIVIGLLAFVAIAYASSFHTVTVRDGLRDPQSVRTQETTVEGVLRDAGISLRGDDIIDPPLDTEIRSQEIITIKRARLMRLVMAGQQLKMVRTQRENARDLLQDIGYPLGAFDTLLVNGEFVEALPKEPVTTSTPGSDVPGSDVLLEDPVVANVEILRAVPVRIHELGQEAIEIQTIAQTVGEALLQAGNIVYFADRVEPDLGMRVTAGMMITVERAKIVTVLIDGTPVQIRSHARTVGELLSSMKIVLLDEDYARPALDTAIENGGEVRVVRVTRELQVRREPIDFETYWEPNGELELDSEVLAQEGAAGVRELQDRVVFEDGQEVIRTLVVDRVIEAVKPRIYNYGTNIIVREMATPAGTVQYWRKIKALATSYSASTSGVSRSASYYGFARCGQVMRRGIVAVDPRVIPLGTTVYVEGYGVGLACDTGSAVIGKRIDLGYGDNDLEHWYRSVDVYILTPVPLNPRYRLN
jgi:uncharacterized protein YabE (DUF348 family)